MSTMYVSTVPADGLARLGAKTSVGKAMTKFRPRTYGAGTQMFDISRGHLFLTLITYWSVDDMADIS